MRHEDIRRWADNWRAAAERERLDLQEAPPKDAFLLALSLISLTAALHGWPVPESERDRLEDLRAYDDWARLRRAFVRS
jgi:hypothetical protein